MSLKQRTFGVGLALALTLALPRAAAAAPIGLELLLLVDVSLSVVDTEYALQKQGYIDAFNDPATQAAVAGIAGGVAVAYAEWSSFNQQALLVGWTQITGAASSMAFADSIAATSRAFAGQTAPGSAINWAVPLFINGFEGARLVIDVSGDGSENSGANTFAAATAARALGITINGLPILGSDAGLDTWYQNNIGTPGGGFVLVANDFSDFAGTVTAKIGREITQVPEPGTFMLVGIGLLAAACRRWRAAR